MHNLVIRYCSVCPRESFIHRFIHHSVIIALYISKNIFHFELHVVVLKSDNSGHERNFLSSFQRLRGPYVLRSSKTSGKRKLSMDQSSARLFWRGVPVSSSLLAVWYCFSSLKNEENYVHIQIKLDAVCTK